MTDSDEARQADSVLPPRPDPHTGEPFPPRAPGYTGPDVKPEDNPTREIRLSRKPSSPPGMGTVLVWHRENTRGKVLGFAISAGLIIGGLAVISLLNGDGLDMLVTWQLWPVIIVGAYLMSNPFNINTLSAGADWIQWEQSRWIRRNWLKIYELTKIEVTYGSGQIYLDLYDDERGMSRTVGEFQRDRRIWDLLYNGIVHSVANGAEIKPNAIGVLSLNSSPALRLRRERQD